MAAARLGRASPANVLQLQATALPVSLTDDDLF